MSYLYQSATCTTPLLMLPWLVAQLMPPLPTHLEVAHLQLERLRLLWMGTHACSHALDPTYLELLWSTNNADLVSWWTV
jgi:hypothetical protein